MTPDHPVILIVQKWEESERGWGARPDGYSLHLTEEDRVAYIAANHARYVELYGDRVPDECDRPCGTPYAWEANEATIELVRRTPHGLRVWDSPYPGTGGTDGWVNVL